MNTTPLVQHSVSTLCALPSFVPSPSVAHVVSAGVAQDVVEYAPMPAAATAPATNMVVNPWLGGGVFGGEHDDRTVGGTFTSGFATKRIRPGRLEGMT